MGLIQIPPRPAFCAACVEEHGKLRPVKRAGRYVWLCPGCATDGPAADLRPYAEAVEDRRPWHGRGSAARAGRSLVGGVELGPCGGALAGNTVDLRSQLVGDRLERR